MREVRMSRKYHGEPRAQAFVEWLGQKAELELRLGERAVVASNVSAGIRLRAAWFAPDRDDGLEVEIIELSKLWHPACLEHHVFTISRVPEDRWREQERAGLLEDVDSGELDLAEIAAEEGVEYLSPEAFIESVECIQVPTVEFVHGCDAVARTVLSLAESGINPYTYCWPWSSLAHDAKIVFGKALEPFGPSWPNKRETVSFARKYMKMDPLLPPYGFRQRAYCAPWDQAWSLVRLLQYYVEAEDVAELG